MTTLIVGAVIAVALVIPSTASASRIDFACGTPLSADAVADIVRLSETTIPTGATLQRLEQAVEQHRRITEILVLHRDRRGLLALGLDTVEQAAVIPLQRAPAVFDDPEFAHRISPLWRFYFVGNGLALQDPALVQATRAEIDALWRSADAAFVVLAANGGLWRCDGCYRLIDGFGSPYAAAMSSELLHRL
jgi:hypothetical protein